MKILHITNSIAEGGVESLLLDILPRMVAAGHTVDLLVLDKNRVEMSRAFENRGVRVIRSNRNSARHPGNIFLIRRLMRRYDLTHVHLFPGQYYAVIAKWLRPFRRTPLVTTEHNTVNNRRSHRIFKLLDSLIYRRYSRIIAISEGTRTNLKEWAGVDSTLVYNGIDLSRFEDKNVHAVNRSTLGFSAQDVLMIMVARFFHQKDQATIIRALPLLPARCSLVLVGSGGTEMEDCRALAAELGVQKRVCFAGRQSRPQDYIAACDIGVLSSHFEGFGLAAVEYMALGKPTVVSDLDGLREAVSDAALLVDPQNAESLARQIARLIDNPSLMSALSERARNRAAQLSVDNTVAGYLEVYRNILL